jgi:hypothetical protein
MALDVKLAGDLPLLHEEQPVEFVALQPVAIVDHVCSVDEDTLRSIVDTDEIGGSRRVEQEDIQQLLGSLGSHQIIPALSRFACACTCLMSIYHAAAVGDFTTKAGGSAANTTKGESPPHAKHTYDYRTYYRVTPITLLTSEDPCSEQVWLLDGEYDATWYAGSSPHAITSISAASTHASSEATVSKNSAACSFM